MTIKRSLLLVLLAVFTGYVTWRVLWFKYDPELLYRSLPPDVVFVSEHDALAERWSGILRHPVAAPVGDAFGLVPGALEKLARDKGTQAVFDRFGARKTLLAYAPAFGPRRNPAWLLVSWGGVHAQFARWGFYGPILKNFERHTLPNRRSGWVLKTRKGTASPFRLSLAVAQGMLFATYSEDPDDVAWLVDRMERGRGPIIRDRLAGAASLGAGTPDRAWIQVAEGWDPRKTPGWTMALHVEGATPARIEFGGALASFLPLGWRMRADGSAEDPCRVRDELAHVIGNVPAGLVLVPYGHAAVGLELAHGSPFTRIVDACLAGYDPGVTHVFATPAGLDFSGRILGMRTPSVLVGFRTATPPDARRLLAVWLDRINAQTQMGLIAKPYEDQPERRIYELDAVRFPALSALSGEERPAVAILGNWVIVASNRALLTRLPLVAPEAGTVGIPWHAAAGDTAALSGCGGYLWADLGELTRVYALFLGIHDVVTFSPFRKPTPLRHNLDVVRQWLALMAPLGVVKAWSHTDGERGDVTILLGAPKTPARSTAR